MGLRSYISIAGGLIASVAMVGCLSKSSFFEMQFTRVDSTTSVMKNLIALFALFVAVLLISPHLDAMLMKVHHSHFVLQVLIQCFFFSVSCAVGFLLKNQKLGVHLTCQKSCVKEDQKTTHENPYGLCSLAGFDVLALIISWERDEKVELGFFSILLQLTMEISLEIPGTDGELNIWFALATALFSVTMIFARRREVSIVNNTIRSGLKLFAAVVGVVFLYLCSFTEEQFEDSKLTKGVLFIIFGVLLVLTIPHARYCLDKLAEACQDHFLVKALVGSLLLLFVSVLIFLNRYPGFRTTLPRVSCVAEEGNLGSHGNLFDLLSAGAFSVYALIISSQKRQPMELGFFSFSLELTMYTCVEISEKNPGVWFLCSFAFCSGLMLARSYLGSLIEAPDPAAEEAIQMSSFPGMSTVSNEHVTTTSNGAASENSGDGGSEPIETESVAVAEHTATGDGEDEPPAESGLHKNEAEYP